jgi:hypothetical protein
MLQPQQICCRAAARVSLRVTPAWSVSTLLVAVCRCCPLSVVLTHPCWMMTLQQQTAAAAAQEAAA